MADDPRHFAARLCLPAPSVHASLVAVFPAMGRYSAAETLLGFARHQRGDDPARGAGVAYFIAGKSEDAAAAFASIRQKTARDWNDLAAAEMEVAHRQNRVERWIGALEAVHRAIELDPLLPEALYNRATIVDHLGLTPVAPAYWRTYVTAEPDSHWGRRIPLAPNSGVVSSVTSATTEELRQIVMRSPQEARAAGEGSILVAWGAARTSEEARQHLERARIIGNGLQRQSGECLVMDAVKAIDRARYRESLRAGHVLYGEGRMALSIGDHAGAEKKLGESGRALAAARSPMAAAADVYRAIAIRNQSRSAEALEMLRTILASERAAGGTHKGLIARIQHEIALCEAERGHWSASLAAAREAVALFEALRESGNAAAAEAIVSEDYDFLGRRELAWRHGVSALRGVSASKNRNRARVAIAALMRTEMRAREWGRARALAQLDRQLGASDPKPEPRLDAGMLLRLATTEAHLGNGAAAARAIASARAAATRIRDGAVRAKMIADIDGAAGAIARRNNPRLAVTLLTTAIRFQQHSTRPIMLPELYLERGRAHVAISAWAAAERDFEDGIRELERQRTRVSEAELRPGLFDDAAELFYEAVAHQVQRGAGPDAVLAYIERGRARAVLEQIDASDHSVVLPRAVALSNLQRHLPAGTALIESMSLPKYLVIVVVTAERAVLRTVPVERHVLAARAADWGGLYELLVEPIVNDLHGVSALTIVPDDVLQRVPFAALFDRSSRRHLVERYTIATAPSAAVFVSLSERQRNAPAPKSPRVLVFANPAFSREAFPTLASLAGAEHEAAVVGRFYTQSQVVMRTEATPAVFFARAPQCHVFHFAGHAVVRHDEPNASALLCAASPGDDGTLTLREIASTRFPATQAVVLAACSTMTGRNAAIEGVQSLARAFIIAGVPAVVGTLWDVDDRAAAPVMRTLHQHLARGVPAAEALRSAQLAAIKAGQPVENWAAFAVTGGASPQPPTPF